MIARSLDGAAAASDAATGRFEIRTQDCIEFLRDQADSSVDVIVTDPAYSGMNQHMRFGHGRIVGSYGKPDNERWFHEFSDDPETSCSTASPCSRSAR
jgi:site-specific DNA-methyltransferase (adenine-specific)